MTKLKLEDCRPEVLAFALAMEERLRANDHKGGWKQERLQYLLDSAREEVEEVESAARSQRPMVDIARESADAANYLMMIADNSGGLSHFAYWKNTAEPLEFPNWTEPI